MVIFFFMVLILSIDLLLELFAQGEFISKLIKHFLIGFINVHKMRLEVFHGPLHLSIRHHRMS